MPSTHKKKSSGTSTRRMTITPELAKKFLANNPDNRNVQKSVVRKYTREILAGNWVYNGEPIQISQKGRLINGQHRLLAVIEANEPIECLVVTGLPDTDIIRSTIDTGVIRTFADALTISGEYDVPRGPMTHVLAGAVGLLHRYLTDNHGSKNTAATHQEKFETLGKHPKLLNSLNSLFALGKGHKTGVPASVLVLVHYMGSRGSSSVGLADEFLEAAVLGSIGDTAVKTDHPAFVLRERISRLRSTPGTKPNTLYIVNLAIKAWNFYYEGRSFKTINSLQWNQKKEGAQYFVNL